MADEKYRLALLLELLELVIALCLEEHVADTESLIDDQNLRVDVDGHRERESYEHSARVGLDRLVDKVADVSEGNDFLQPGIDLLAGEAHDRTVDINILQTGVFRVEARAEL